MHTSNEMKMHSSKTKRSAGNHLGWRAGTVQRSEGKKKALFFLIFLYAQSVNQLYISQSPSYIRAR